MIFLYIYRPPHIKSSEGAIYLKRVCALLTALLLLCTLLIPVSAYDELSTDAKACIVIDAQTGRVLGGHNIHERLPMASTTKIMTALLALEHGDLDQWFTVDSDAIHVEGSSMGLQDGNQVTLRALLYGMMLPSGNDAANATAVHISGDMDSFVAKMNWKASELGLRDTQFRNPSGLDAEGHFSSAYDMAQLCREAMKHDIFQEICCLSKAQVEFGNPPYRRWLENYNKLLTMYPYCIGVKTGFTEAAYRCLVSAAEKDGMTLICVTLNCPDDWSVHESLYERYFSNLNQQDLSSEIPRTLPMTNSALNGEGTEVSEVAVRPAQNLMLPLKSSDSVSVQLFRKPMIFAPVSEGAVLGEIQITINGENVLTTELLAVENLSSIKQEKEPSLIDRLRDFALQLF